MAAGPAATSPLQARSLALAAAAAATEEATVIMPHRTLSNPIPLLLSCMLFVACGSYDVTINDQLVYTPRPLFEDYTVTDPALQACIARAIASGKVTAASELASLDCANAGIQTLDGLATFTELEHLRLSGNQITDIAAIGSLTVLQELYLDNNRVVAIVDLYQLPALRLVDLSGNPGLSCPDSGGLLRLDTVLLPAHCP